MKLCYYILFLVLISSGMAQELPPRPPLPENMFIINEDNSHFFGTRQPEEMTVNGLNAFIDQYADTKVTHLFLCPNASRANFVNSARDAIWAPNSEGIEPTGLWPQNCKLLHEKGLDPYKIWIDRCREKKISPWLSMRMNDLHCVEDPTNFMHSSFWVNHPELWISSGLPALHFKHEEVRKHIMDFIAVLFDRYDFDGLELDWMRFTYYLTPGHEPEESAYLTEIVRYARQLADEYSVKRGHPIYLGVRVPSDPEAAAGLGVDCICWAKEKLIDLLVPCPFWSSSDFDIPIERWNELLAGCQVAVAPGIEYNVRAYPTAEARPATLADLYGFVASEKSRGTTNIYLFNWMDSETLPVSQDEYRQILKDGFDDAFLAQVTRTVPLTYRDTVPSGVSNNSQLPRETESTVAFHIPIGPKPTRNTGNYVVIGLESREGLEESQFSATLNGVEASEVTKTEPFTTSRLVVIREGKEQTLAMESCSGMPGVKSCFQFEFPAEAFTDGSNEFTVTQTSGKPQKIVFVFAGVNGK